MRVAMILSSLANKGPIVVAKEIVNNIKRHVENIQVFYFDEIQELDFDCKTEQISFFTKRDWSRFDIIHSHSLRPDAYVYFHKKEISAYCVSTLHNYIEEDLKFTYNKPISVFFSKIWIKSLAKHDHIVTLSRHMTSYYSQLLIDTQISSVYNARTFETPNLETIDKNDLLLIQALKKDHFLVGAFAGLTARKGIHQLIQALARDKKLAILIIGSGKEKGKLEKLAESLGVKSRCLFLGYRPNVKDYFCLIDAYGMVSYSEGFGLVVIEAMLNSIPVVCSNIPVLRELYSDTEVSFFELNNIKSLLSSINRTKKYRKKYTKNAINKVTRHYTVHNMILRYLEIYRQSNYDTKQL